MHFRGKFMKKIGFILLILLFCSLKSFAEELTVEKIIADSSKTYKGIITYRGRAKWPVEVSFTSINKRKKRFVGRLYWKTYKAITRIEGSYTKDKMKFKEVAYIKKGAIALRTVYTLTYKKGDFIKGSWIYPGQWGNIQLRVKEKVINTSITPEKVTKKNPEKTKPQMKPKKNKPAQKIIKTKPEALKPVKVINSKPISYFTKKYDTHFRFLIPRHYKPYYFFNGGAKRYYYRILAFNPQEVSKEVALYKKHKSHFYVTQLDKRIKALKIFAKKSLKKEINTYISSCYQIVKRDVFRSIQGAKDAHYLAKAALLILPEEPVFKTLLIKSVLLKQEMQKAIGGPIYKSTFHKQNAKKIVFSSKQYDVKNDPIGKKKVFIPGDKVYLTAYFNDYIGRIWYRTKRGYLKIFVNGKNTYERGIYFSYLIKQSYYQIQILPDGVSQKVPYKLAFSFIHLKPKLHEIEVKISDSKFSNKIFASGKFVLDCRKGTAFYKKLQAEVRKLYIERTRMPYAAMKDRYLERQFTNFLLRDRRWMRTPLRAAITSSRWTVIRNRYSGAIKKRTITFALAVEDIGGKCWVYHTNIAQDFRGSSYGRYYTFGVSKKMRIYRRNVFK